MNDLQKTILDIMKSFHNFAQENGIQYFICYGTLLGAVRHQGFIPWDDDIDIVMTRDNLNKLIALAPKLPENLGLLTYETNKNYMYNFAKIEKTDTSFVEELTLKSNYIAGVYIDIFPMDRVPNDEKVIREIWLKQRRLQNLIYSHYTQDTTSSNFVIKSLKKILTHIDVTFLHKRLDKIITQFNKNTEYKDYFAFANTFEYLLFEEKDMEAVEYVFEDTKLYSFKNYDKILKSVYGDYMTLPSEEKRTTHKPFYLNLTHRITEEELEVLKKEKNK